MTSESSGQVVIGTQNYLYLGSGHHRVLDYLTGAADIDSVFFERFDRNIEARRAYADRVGAAYVHCVAPDKHSVVREHFPIAVRSPVGQRFRERTGAHFLFPLDELRHCPRSCGYLKTDTHMDFEGRVALSCAMLAELGLDEATIARHRHLFAGLSSIHPDFSGDLGSKLTPRRHEVAELGVQYERYRGVFSYSNHISGNNGLITVHFNAGGESRNRLLVLGDSFMIHCLPILSLFFRETFFLRTPYFHPEIADAFEPTHIITSNAERYLPAISNDQDAPLGLLMASLNGKVWSDDPQQSRAINAALQPNGPHSRNFRSEIARQSLATDTPGKIMRV
ncbi:hypothetical protein GN316_18100 [Xylophilus sp. Kf1]|nr:hypothetical protein [Xylophilus sp. Kf1]